MSGSSSISFVCWKWHQPGSERQFLAEHVNVLYAMVARWYPLLFRFVCITDDVEGLDLQIETMPLPVRLNDIHSPQGRRFPSCYCRLWNFSEEATILGERICQIDIDVVIVGDLRPLIDRDEDFVGWCDERSDNGTRIAGGIYLLRTGSMPLIWWSFDRETSPLEAFKAGFYGSDQAWMSYVMNRNAIGKWTQIDGLTKINWTPLGAHSAPKGARIVFTNGAKPPWSKEVQKSYPWLKDHYYGL